MVKNKTFRLLVHFVFGCLLLWFFNWLLTSLEDDNFIFIGVCICVVFCSLIAEKVQQLLNIGANTSQGALRTCIILIPYIIYHTILLIK